MGNLAVVDPCSIDKKAFKKHKEHFMISHTRAAMILLFEKLDQLPFEMDRQGRIIELPEETLDIPREKPLPKAKPLTRWEKFAQEKGIEKKRRSQMVFDEKTEEYKPRHGKDRFTAEGEEKKGPWLMVGSNGKPDDHDPYAARLDDKKKSKEKQKMQEQRNVEEQAQKGYKGPLTVSGKLRGKAEDMDKTSAKGKLKDDLLVAQLSTASMGKFDRRVEDEPEIGRQKGKRRKLLNSVHSDLGGEKDQSLKMLDKMVGDGNNAKFNADKAANIHQEIVDRAIREKHEAKSDRAGGKGKKRRSATGKEKKYGKKKK